MTNIDLRTINTTALAFMGDAVYEVYVRKYVMEQGIVAADTLHKIAVKYVKAEAQADAIKKLMKDFLTEEEISLVKRARNRKSTSKSRSAGPVAYKLATAFEALIGYLYLGEQEERAEEIMSRAVAIIDGDDSWMCKGGVL